LAKQIQMICKGERMCVVKRVLGLLVTLALIFSSGCNQIQESIHADDDTVRVVTSFYPIYLLTMAAAEGVSGIHVENMAQPETGCLHDYELTTADMKKLENADMLIINGGGMEHFLDKVIERYPDLVIVDTSEGIALIADDGHAHDHDLGVGLGLGEHIHEENAHIWLLPAHAARQVETIAEALIALHPVQEAVIRENHRDFAAEAEALYREASAISAEHIHAGIFHEGFAYFAPLFDIHLIFGIYVEEYSEPSAQEVVVAIDLAKAEGIRIFLAAEDAGRGYAEMIAGEAGGQVVILNPITNGDYNEDYLDLMRENIRVLAGALQE